jgi:choline dehydrogenase-like flavoprotein
MGNDPNTSVTDAMGRVRGTDGLYVADTSVFPTGGDRHPTLTLLALAARTADSIVRVARGSG